MSELNNANVKMVADALAVGNTANSAANNALAGSFYGATVQNVLASRAIGVTYTNTSGRPIAVFMVADGVASSQHDLQVFIQGLLVIIQSFRVIGEHKSMFFLVPDGATYSTSGAGANPTITIWHEVRL